MPDMPLASTTQVWPIYTVPRQHFRKKERTDSHHNMDTGKLVPKRDTYDDDDGGPLIPT